MNQALNRLLQENKTAFYVFDIEKLKARIAHLQAALPPEVVLCYAVKANTFITKELIDTIHRFEVCSPGEAVICRAVGVPSENMVFWVPEKNWMPRMSTSGVSPLRATMASMSPLLMPN